MQVPANMTVPPLRLAEGERVIGLARGLRKRGLFGNRYGALVVTNTRVAFVKAVVKAGILTAMLATRGVGPMFAFDRKAVRAERSAWRALPILVLSDGARSERFVLDAGDVERMAHALA